MRVNEFGQPIGPDLAGWQPPPTPAARAIEGRVARLQPLARTAHAAALFHAFEAASAALWTYMPFGPFRDAADLGRTIDAMAGDPHWQPYAVLVDDVPAGFLSYLRIDPGGGVIEIGSIAFSPRLQRTTAATEAVYLLIRHAFELGYRRCEWKCDDLNEPSRVAADRLGFAYEGTFRNATHYKGRSRDTAWYAIVDRDWPHLDGAFRAWLAPGNFDEGGRQRRSLRELRDRD